MIALTGATGFVGRYVLDALLARGYPVKALARCPEALKAHDKLTIIKGALGEANEVLVQDCNTLIHIAGLIKARKRADYFAVNDKAARDLAEAAQKAGVERLILMSSMAARAPHLSDYAASKQAGERSVRDAFQGELVIIRAPAVFGPNDPATKPLFDMINRGFLPVPGGTNWKERRLSFAYAPDLAQDMVERGLNGDYDAQTVSPATLAQVTWPEFTALCAQARGGPVRVLPIPPLALLPVAMITSFTSRWLGLGHLTLGKWREFLYEDWSSTEVIDGATPMRDALGATLTSYANTPK